jgi:hypothetical protein
MYHANINQTIRTLSPRGAGPALSQAARGTIAQELDDASLTSSDSQAIVKLISKTVMGPEYKQYRCYCH